MYSQVTVTAKNKGEVREFWFIFETDHQTLAQQIDALTADRGLLGLRHDTRPLAPNDGLGSGRLILDSYEYYIGQNAVTAISECRYPLFAFSGERLK